MPIEPNPIIPIHKRHHWIVYTLRLNIASVQIRNSIRSTIWFRWLIPIFFLQCPGLCICITLMWRSGQPQRRDEKKKKYILWIEYVDMDEGFVNGFFFVCSQKHASFHIHARTSYMSTMEIAVMMKEQMRCAVCMTNCRFLYNVFYSPTTHSIIRHNVHNKLIFFSFISRCLLLFGRCRGCDDNTATAIWSYWPWASKRIAPIRDTKSTLSIPATGVWKSNQPSRMTRECTNVKYQHIHRVS